MTVFKLNQHEAKTFQKFWRKVNVVQVFLWEADNREEFYSFMESSYGGKLAYPCPLFLTDYMVVMSNGKVAMCCMDYDGLFLLGDLSKQKINDVRNSRKFKNLANLHLSGKGDLVKLCKNCDHLYRSHYIWYFKYFSYLLKGTVKLVLPLLLLL
jgi:radical SAM protein with 4Fe4S-binding SPASM domain